MIRKKAKAMSANALADSINQIEADADGISLKEFYIRQKIRTRASREYSKTHWVQDLSDNQKFLITTTTSVPHTYMELPLSKGNEVVVAQYKNTSENYKRWVIRNKEFSAELEHASKVKKNLNQAMESMRRSTAPLKKASEAIAKEYQELGRKLRFKEEEIVNKRIKLQIQQLENSIDNQRGILSLAKVNPMVHSAFLAHKANKEQKVAVANGLNTLMRKNGIKKPYLVGKHYLATHADPKKADYVVDSYDNPIALAEATGMSSKRLFEMVCNELVKSSKLYAKKDFERNAYSVEELLNLFDSKVASSKHTKYTQKLFYNSKDRATWSTKYQYDWKNYKRFSAEFSEWNKTFKAKAKKREDHEVDMFANFAYENSKGK